MKIIISEEQLKSVTSKINSILNESFFDRGLTAENEFFETLKDFLYNFKFIAKEKHKVDFFASRIIKSVKKLKHVNISPAKLTKFEKQIKKEFDEDVLLELGLFELLSKLDNREKKDKYIDTFVEYLDVNIGKAYDEYDKKLKADKTYDLLNSMKDNEPKITPQRFEKEKFGLQVELLKLQEWVIKNNKKILVIFEGRDAAGKSANIDSLTENLNPKHYRVESFGIPTEEEKNNWFKRYEKVLPEEGEIVFFDRSWYNRGIIEPAMGYCSPEQYEEFMNKVCDFEKNLIKKGFHIIKIWLNITRNRQLTRFELRKRDPLKYWKFSDNDEKILKKWDKLTPYIKIVLDDTTSEECPWNVINSDDKMMGILNSKKLILNSFDYDGKNYSLFGKNEKIIFLDLHGVIITDIHFEENGEHDCTKGYDEEAIKNLNKLTDETDAKIVVISHCKSRMKWSKLVKLLKKEGVTGHILGKTIDIDKHLREEQISAWFKMNGKSPKWIVLDDTHYEDYNKSPENIVYINAKKGVTEKDVKKAEEKLT